MAEINGTTGNDRIGFNDSFLYPPSTENDLIRGFEGDDSIDGGQGNDTMFGSIGNDFLHISKSFSAD